MSFARSTGCKMFPGFLENTATTIFQELRSAALAQLEKVAIIAILLCTTCQTILTCAGFASFRIRFQVLFREV